MSFTLLTWNIMRGGVGRAAPIAAVVNACAPDLVLFQEATSPDVVRELAQATGMEEWRAFDRQSLAFMSRIPVAHASWHRPRVSRHAFVEVHPARHQVHVFGVHLSAVHAAWTEQRRVFELRALLDAVRKDERGVHVLAGDFNTLDPDASLDVQRLPLRLRPMLWATGGRVRWRTISTVLAAGYVDAFRERHPDSPGFTMPTWDPHVRLDYTFVPAAHASAVESCEVVTHPDVPAASDHFPLLVRLADQPRLQSLSPVP